MSKRLVQIVKARNWALASFSSFKNPYIHINISDYPEEYKLILEDVPQYYNDVKIPNWLSCVDVVSEMNYMIYYKGVSDDDIEPENLYIYRFEENEYIYYGLYDEQRRRVGDKCLILSDKCLSFGECDSAYGRCPYVIETIEV